MVEAINVGGFWKARDMNSTRYLSFSWLTGSGVRSQGIRITWVPILHLFTLMIS